MIFFDFSIINTELTAVATPATIKTMPMAWSNAKGEPVIKESVVVITLPRSRIHVAVVAFTNFNPEYHVKT